MEDLLENLFYGDLSPCETELVRQPFYREAEQEFQEELEALAKALDGPGMERLERLLELRRQQAEALYMEYFKKGFRLGVQLLHTGLGEERSDCSTAG